jgi:hypothetical protein
LLTRTQGHVLFGIHLPGLVRGRGPRPGGPRPTTRRGGGQPGLPEPPLQRAFRGDGVAGGLRQMDSNQAGSPGGMLATQPHGGLGQDRGRGRDDFRVVVVRRGAGEPSLAKSPDQPPDGRAGQAEALSDLVGGMPLLPESEQGLADGDRDGAWHGRTSRGYRHETKLLLLYQRHGPIKLGVGISRSNFMSGDTQRAPDRPPRPGHAALGPGHPGLDRLHNNSRELAQSSCDRAVARPFSSRRYGRGLER